MLTEWNLGRHGNGCSLCARAFEPGEMFGAMLFATPTAYERRDYCLSCFPADDPAAIGYWKTRRHAGSVRAPMLDREALLEMYSRLEGSDDPARVQLRFALALLLWRKKALRFVDTTLENNRETWRFAARDGQVHAVTRPDLDETELERLSENLERLLAGGGIEAEAPESGEATLLGPNAPPREPEAHGGAALSGPATGYESDTPHSLPHSDASASGGAEACGSSHAS